MYTPEELGKRIDEHGLTRFKEAILGSVEPCYALTAMGEVMDDLPISSSKLGGLPHLPTEFPWPKKGNRPLMFLAQINLADILRDHVQDNSLPSSGLLTFWYDTAEEPWGFDPKDRGAFQVHYVSASGLESRDLPPFNRDGLADEPHWPWTPFNECELVISPSFSYKLDQIDDIFELESELGEEEADNLSDALYDFIDELRDDSTNHQLLGMPNEIQGDMKVECQLVSNGIYLGNSPPDSEREKIESLKPGAKDWRLLLQLDSDEDAPGWMWGDCGMIYFWIKDQDLNAADFTNGWGVLQCS